MLVFFLWIKVCLSRMFFLNMESLWLRKWYKIQMYDTNCQAMTMKNPNKWIFFKFVAKSTSSFDFLLKRIFFSNIELNSMDFKFCQFQVPVHDHWCFKIQSQAKFRLGSSNWKSNVIEFNQAWNPQRKTYQNLQCQNNFGCKFRKEFLNACAHFSNKQFLTNHHGIQRNPTSDHQHTESSDGRISAYQNRIADDDSQPKGDASQFAKEISNGAFEEERRDKYRSISKIPNYVKNLQFWYVLVKFAKEPNLPI